MPRYGSSAVGNPWSAPCAAIGEARLSLQNGQYAAIDALSLARRAREIVLNTRPLLRPVINATGILLHTGLGRAPLAEEAVEAVAAVARGYCNLEFELEGGERGRRTSGIARLLRELTGAEAATVVNNNAGATVLALRVLAAGREVIVSRGQLVEIGGSFRLPEIFGVSGARLHEVGTTNKTRLSDYERAIGPETAAILRVHHSNFRIVGFTEEAPLDGLAQLAHDRGLAMIDDIGSGALAPGQPPGVGDEPLVSDGIAAGADLVLFSGDKLLGGPQCGILVGTEVVIGRIEADPLMRSSGGQDDAGRARDHARIDSQRSERCRGGSALEHVEYPPAPARGPRQAAGGRAPGRAGPERLGRYLRVVHRGRERAGAAHSDSGRERRPTIPDRS